MRSVFFNLQIGDSGKNADVRIAVRMIQQDLQKFW